MKKRVLACAASLLLASCSNDIAGSGSDLLSAGKSVYPSKLITDETAAELISDTLDESSPRTDKYLAANVSCSWNGIYGFGKENGRLTVLAWTDSLLEKSAGFPAKASLQFEALRQDHRSHKVSGNDSVYTSVLKLGSGLPDDTSRIEELRSFNNGAGAFFYKADKPQVMQFYFLHKQACFSLILRVHGNWSDTDLQKKKLIETADSIIARFPE